MPIKPIDYPRHTKPTKYDVYKADITSFMESGEKAAEVTWDENVHIETMANRYRDAIRRLGLYGKVFCSMKYGGLYLLNAKNYRRVGSRYKEIGVES